MLVTDRSPPAQWCKDDRIKLDQGVRAGWIDRVAKQVYATGGPQMSHLLLVRPTSTMPVQHSATLTGYGGPA